MGCKIMASLLLAIIYISFISLGLPDSLLGSAWPVIYPQLQVPISYSGIIYIIISLGTVISSLQSDRLTKKLGAGKVTAISVAATAAALFGFSFSHSFLALCLWAVPYGLGAGSVDAALNNYVALYYSSRHMSWLHCMWGVGASVGPYIMSHAIVRYDSWNMGYRIIGIMQVVLSAMIFCSLPLWERKADKAQKQSPENSRELKETGIGEDEESVRPIPLKDVIHIDGAKEILLAFFCYSAIEQTTGLWASSFLVLQKGIAEAAATGFAGLFFLGITAGRALNGFLTIRFKDRQLIVMGEAVIAIGLLLITLPFSNYFALAGLVVIGLGCAPIYPCIIHSTPVYFGRENSQAMVGVQMAAAYTANILMPPVFGVIVKKLSVSLLPLYLLMILVIMFVMYERVSRKKSS